MRLFDMDSKEDYLLDRKYKVATPYAPCVDVVEVVRCKDCDSYVELAWWFDDEGKKKECHCCVAHSIPVQPNDYCSYGERKEE